MAEKFTYIKVNSQEEREADLLNDQLYELFKTGKITQFEQYMIDRIRDTYYPNDKLTLEGLEKLREYVYDEIGDMNGRYVIDSRKNKDPEYLLRINRTSEEKNPYDIPEEKSDNPFNSDETNNPEELESQEESSAGFSSHWSEEEVQLLGKMLPTTKNLTELQKYLPNKTIEQINRKIFNLHLHKGFRGYGEKVKEVKRSSDGKITLAGLKERGFDASRMQEKSQNLLLSYVSYLEQLTGRTINFDQIENN